MGVRHSIDQKMIKKLPRTRAMFGLSIEFRGCMSYNYSNCALLVQTVGDILHFSKTVKLLNIFQSQFSRRHRKSLHLCCWNCYCYSNVMVQYPSGPQC